MDIIYVFLYLVFKHVDIYLDTIKTTTLLITYTQFFLPMVSCKFCYQETCCVLIYGEGVFLLSYTNVLHANIFLIFMIWG